MDGRGVSGDINGNVFAVGVMPWCIFGVNVPGFNGKLLGRKNLLLALVTLLMVVIVAVNVDDIEICALSSSITFLLLLAFGDVDDVDDVADNGRCCCCCGDPFDDTSICNGDLAVVRAICLGLVVKISAFGIKFSKLKWRTSISSSSVGSFSFSAKRCVIFIGLKLSAIREKLKLLRLFFSCSRNFIGCTSIGIVAVTGESHELNGLLLLDAELPNTPVNADGVARCNSSSVIADDDSRVRLFGDGPCGDVNEPFE